MRIIVTAQALFDDGELAWGYHHEENIVGKSAKVDPADLVAAMREGKKLPEGSQEEIDQANRESAAQTLEKLLEQLDLARASVLDQAASEMIDGTDEAPRP